MKIVEVGAGSSQKLIDAQNELNETRSAVSIQTFDIDIVPQE